MKHPVPLLIATLFAFIFSLSSLRDKTCPCGVAPATSDVSMSVGTKLAAAVPTPVNYTETKAVENVAPTAAKADAARIQAIEQRLKAQGLVLYFDNAQSSTSLTESQRAQLADIQYYLSHNPNNNVKVVGHTDSRGSVGYNERLSTARANFVADYLKKLGTNEQNFNANGQGEDSPAATNSTANGRARNRRVVISLS
ncbi:MAG: OmpA family protein [Saprospiraceae bacterium]|nr:OmpA family protein [Saprospiraceae bacterium]